MFVDKNGKFFGKISIIDVIICAFIILVLVFGGMFLSKNNSVAENKITVRYTVEVTEKNDEYVNHIIVGEKVIDGVTKQEMGKIVDVSTKDAVKIAEDLKGGRYVAASIPGKKDVYITMELLADVNYPDLLAGSVPIKIGSEAALRSESVAMHGYIVDVDVDSEELRRVK